MVPLYMCMCVSERAQVHFSLELNSIVISMAQVLSSLEVVYMYYCLGPLVYLIT